MLSSDISALLRKKFKLFPEIRQVFLYGSRAKGQEHTHSDIDLALLGPHLSSADFARLKYTLMYEMPTFIPIEIARLDGADSQFVQRVQMQGVIIYDRDAS